jgi:hypothetical protein
MAICSVWQSHAIHRMQRQFLAAWEGDAAARASFVQRHHGRPLGALAAYALANERGKNGDWNGAAELYGHGTAMDRPGLDGIAALARAVALVRADRTDQARQLLTLLVSNGKRSPTVLGGALYLQALIAYRDGQFSLVRSTLDALGQVSSSGVWTEKAALLDLALRQKI